MNRFIKCFYVNAFLLCLNHASAALNRQPSSIEVLENAYIETLLPVENDRAVFIKDLADMQKAQMLGNFNEVQQATLASNRDSSLLREDIRKASVAAKGVCEAVSDFAQIPDEGAASLYCALEPQILRSIEQDILYRSLEANTFAGLVAATFFPSAESELLSPLVKEGLVIRLHGGVGAPGFR